MTEAVSYLENKVGEYNLLGELVRQVEKDFRMAVDTSITLYADTPAKLVHEVYSELYNIVTKTSVSKFSSLLYRIDIAEKDVKAIQSTDIEDYLQQVTFLVLKREYQKVYIRSTL
ncbi:hypothetical protein LNQ81_07875 [Myroides sp. M-43]|uniref:hypothetical protein n=1 Tax=Myroides oncorhynchi TaxID=2893756 RepID=UPI001E590AA2|nr:hypothetical protein [Myroides oncorhynchi]MCC9042605.1 hypothetical protein [Myroides oncorhynchi]